MIKREKSCHTCDERIAGVAAFLIGKAMGCSFILYPSLFLIISFSRPDTLFFSSVQSQAADQYALR